MDIVLILKVLLLLLGITKLLSLVEDLMIQVLLVPLDGFGNFLVKEMQQMDLIPGLIMLLILLDVIWLIVTKDIGEPLVLLVIVMDNHV